MKPETLKAYRETLASKTVADVEEGAGLHKGGFRIVFTDGTTLDVHGPAFLVRGPNHDFSVTSR